MRDLGADIIVVGHEVDDASFEAHGQGEVPLVCLSCTAERA